MSYYVYILTCKDETLYTGITTDLKKRLKEHNSSDRGAKYTKTRRPVTLSYSETAQNRSEASRREYAIKKLSRAKKLELIASTTL
jgi:putative endonuclease